MKALERSEILFQWKILDHLSNFLWRWRWIRWVSCCSANLTALVCFNYFHTKQKRILNNLRPVTSVVFIFWGAYISTKPTARFRNDENANAFQNFRTFLVPSRRCRNDVWSGHHLWWRIFLQSRIFSERSFWSSKNPSLQKDFERTQNINLTSGLSC